MVDMLLNLHWRQYVSKHCVWNEVEDQQVGGRDRQPHNSVPMTTAAWKVGNRHHHTTPLSDLLHAGCETQADVPSHSAAKSTRRRRMQSALSSNTAGGARGGGRSGARCGERPSSTPST